MPTKNPTLTMLLLLASLLICRWGVAAEPNDTRPNIIVLLCDDLGYGDLECFGHPKIKTPNLNKMANDGIRFTSCYSAAPVCSPSRVGLLTGRSPNRAGVYDWIPWANADSKKKDNRHLVHLQKDETTIPRLMKNAGYATMMSGKWHCNSRFNSDDQPQPGDFGFDHWLATQNNAAPNHRNPTNYVRNGDAVGPLKGYSCQLAMSEALTWLDNLCETKSDKAPPFFMYVAFHEPHEKIASPEELVEQYLPVAKNRKQAEYFANVANVDLAVGKLFQKLEQHKILENTLVIFTSDNGPETLNRYKTADRSWGSAKPLRGMKLWTTDAGFRVAGIAQWAGKIKPGQTIDTPVSSLDFLPTFCELAGTKPPSDLELDGMSILPILEGTNVGREKPLMWAYYNAINEQRIAMRHGKWKILAKIDLPKIQNVFSGNEAKVRSAKPYDFELYDLSNDISESNNLWANEPANGSTSPEASSPEFVENLKGLFMERYSNLTADLHVW